MGRRRPHPPWQGFCRRPPPGPDGVVMYRRLSFLLGVAGATASASTGGAACHGGGTGERAAHGAGATGHPGGPSGDGGGGTGGGAAGGEAAGLAGGGGAGGRVPCGQDPNVDADGDGWTPAEGDCDD